LSRRRYCPACGARMEAELTTHRAVNAQGRAVLYYNVWRYECPNGCATATVDFSEASLDPAGLRRVGQVHVSAGPSGELVVHPPSLLDRIDLSFIITVLGLFSATRCLPGRWSSSRHRPSARSSARLPLR